MSDHYDQWVQKQQAMGRPHQQPIVPIPEFYLGSQEKEPPNGNE